MFRKSNRLCFIFSFCISIFYLIQTASSQPIDGTAFLQNLVHQEIKDSEKECRKLMKKAASCKIRIQKVLITKKSEDTADIKVISHLKIKTKLFIKASADAEIIADATYKIHECKLHIHNVDKKITKLSGVAQLLKPLKKSIKKIDIPTGSRPIKSTTTRDQADTYLKEKLKLTSDKSAEKC